MPALARTNYRRSGNTIGRGWASVTADASGITSVSTGLNSPRYALAFPKASTASRGSCAGIAACYFTASGSIINFQWFSTSAGVTAVMNGCVIGFNWVAFE